MYVIAKMVRVVVAFCLRKNLQTKTFGFYCIFLFFIYTTRKAYAKDVYKYICVSFLF